MKKQFTYDVKLVVQNNQTGELDYIVRSFEVAIEINEHDYYIPFVVSSESVKDEMNEALEQYVKENNYYPEDIYVMNTEVSTNDDMIDISFSSNPAHNIYDRNPDISVEFIPESYKPLTPQFFLGEDKGDHILWTWENVRNCAFRMYNQFDEVIAEMGVGQLSYIETDIIRGENYTRKLVAFDADGESDATAYQVVYLDKEQVDDSLISENRFGYVDVTPVKEVETQVDTMSVFKSGIGDNHDLYVQTNAHDITERFEFDVVVEGEVTEQQSHHTAIETEFKIVAEGTKEEDGAVNSGVDVSVKPWPISVAEYDLKSKIVDDYTVKYEVGVDVAYQKKRPIIDAGGIKPGTGGSGGDNGGTPGNPTGTPTYPGGNWVGGIGTDEDHQWEIEIGGETFGPGDIIWDQIDGSGSVTIKPDGSISGDMPGNIVIEGTLPNGDKVIIEGEVLPPVIDMPTGDNPGNDANGNPLPPVTPVKPGSSGDGGGIGGGIKPTPDQEAEHPAEPEYPPDTPNLPSDHGHCPCIYLYETTTIPLRLTSGGRLMDGAELTFEIHKDPPVFDHSTTPPTYISGCLCCMESDDTTAIEIHPEITIDENTGEEIITQMITGCHVGRTHVYAWYKGKKFHFNVHVVKLAMWIEPRKELIRVGETIEYILKKAPLELSVDPVIVPNDEILWSIDNYCSIKPNGEALGERHGEYTVTALHLNRLITETGTVTPPVIEVDYSTSLTQEFGTDVYVTKLDKSIYARVKVNGALIDNTKLSFKMQDTNTATISDKGSISGVSIGDTQLTISYKGYSVVANVKVIDRLIQVFPYQEEPPHDCIIHSGDTRQITLIDEGSRVHNRELIFRSKTSSIATVDIDGVITGEKAGECIIEVIYRSVIYSIKVKVVPSTLTIEPSPIHIFTDCNEIVRAYRNGKPVEASFRIENTSIATMEYTDVIKGLTPGVTRVIATYKDMTAYADLTVELDPNGSGRFDIFRQGTGYFDIDRGVSETFLLKKDGVMVTEGTFNWSIVNTNHGTLIENTNGQHLVDWVSEADDFLTFENNAQYIAAPDSSHRFDEKLYIKCEYTDSMYGLIKKIKPFSIREVALAYNLTAPTASENNLLSITLYRSNPDNLTNRPLSAEIDFYEQSRMFALTTYVESNTVGFEIYDESLLDVEIVDRRKLKITPKLSGTTYVIFKALGVEKIFKVVIKDHLKFGDIGIDKLDVFSQYTIPLEVNGVIVPYGEYTTEKTLEKDFLFEEDGKVVPQRYSSRGLSVKYTYRGQIISQDFSINKPTLIVAVNGNKLPDMINPYTNEQYPDAYKLDYNGTYNYTLILNNVEIPAKVGNDSDLTLTANSVNYINRLNIDVENQTISKKNQMGGVDHIDFSIRGVTTAVEFQVGEISLMPQGLSDLPYGSKFTLNVVEESGYMLEKDFGIQVGSTTRKNYHMIGVSVTAEDKCGGSAAVVSYHGACEVIQGGMINDIIVKYGCFNDGRIPLKDYERYNEIHSKEFTNFRPWTISTRITTKLPEIEPALMYNSHILFANETIYNAAYIGELLESKALNKLVGFLGTESVYITIANTKPKSTLEENEYDCQYSYSEKHLYPFHEEIVNKDVDVYIRVAGIEIPMKFNHKPHIELGRLATFNFGGCPRHNIDSKSYNQIRELFEHRLYKVGSTFKASFMGNIASAKVYNKGPCVPPANVHSELIRDTVIPNINSMIDTNDNSLVTYQNDSLCIVSEGAIELRPIYADGAYEPTYAYGYDGDTAPIDLLVSKMSKAIVVDSKFDPALVYKFGEVNPSEIRYITDVVLSPDGTPVAKKTGVQEFKFYYRNLEAKSTALVLQSTTPLIECTLSSLKVGSSTKPIVKVDGYSKIEDIEMYRYCTITSSDPSVLFVSKYNVVTGKKVGVATLTISFMNSSIDIVVNVNPLVGTYNLGATHNIVTPNEELLVGFVDANNNPDAPPVSEVTYTMSSAASNNYKLTPTGIQCKFVAGLFGTYTIGATFKVIVDGQEKTMSRSFHVEVANVSATIPKASIRKRRSLMLMATTTPESIPDESGSTRYLPDIVEGYFVKQKTLTHRGSETLKESVANMKVLDILNFAISDSEVKESPSGTVEIEDVRLIANNQPTASFDITSTEVLLTANIDNCIYYANKKGIMPISIKDGRSKPLFNTSSLVYINNLGEVYEGPRLPSSTITYICNREEVVITDGLGNAFPSTIENNYPYLTLTLKTPPEYRDNIILTTGNDTVLLNIKELFVNPLEDKSYTLEIKSAALQGESKMYLGTQEIPIGGTKFYDVELNSTTILKLVGLPDIILSPYYEESEIRTCTINGKRPMRHNNDGLKPFVTIAHAFDVVGQRVREATFKVVILSPTDKVITAKFDHEIAAGVTKTNGDVLTLSSKETEFVDVVSKIRCSTIRSGLFEINTHDKTEIINKVYNPFFDNKHNNLDIRNFKVSAISQNPNVIIYPVEESIDFENTYRHQMSVPWQFEAYVLSPSQSGWSPLIHPGYYFINNDEYFLYKNDRPHGTFVQKEVADTRESFVLLTGITEELKEITTSNIPVPFVECTLTDMMINNDTLIILPVADYGTFEVDGVFFPTPLEEIDAVINGDLYDTTFEISIMQNGIWSEYTPYINCKSIYAEGNPIEGVKLKGHCKRQRGATTPVIKAIHVRGIAENWVVKGKVEKSILAKVKMNTEWHNITNESIEEILLKEMAKTGRGRNRISTVTATTSDADIELLVSNAKEPLQARSQAIKTTIVSDRFIAFDEQGEAIVTPIPRLGRPICIKNGETFLRHLTQYDDKAILTHEHTDTMVFDGIMAMALHYHDIDCLVVKVEDRIIPVKTIINNMVYFEPVAKIKLGEVVTATYKVKNSFTVDYNYNILEKESKISVYLSSEDTDYSNLEVFYETEDEGDYYAREIEINPLYNPINSGFIYIADTINEPSSIELHTTQVEFKQDDAGHSYVLAYVLDKLGNPVPRVKVNASINFGSVLINNEYTNDLGVVPIRYNPPKGYIGEDMLKVTCGEVEESIKFDIREENPPRFIVVKPLHGNYEVALNESIQLSIDMYKDGLIPCATEPIRVRVQNRPETTLTVNTDSKGHCEASIRAIINNGYDICRIEISCNDVKEYLDLKVVI